MIAKRQKRWSPRILGKQGKMTKIYRDSKGTYVTFNKFRYHLKEDTKFQTHADVEIFCTSQMTHVENLEGIETKTPHTLTVQSELKIREPGGAHVENLEYPIYNGNAYRAKPGLPGISEILVPLTGKKLVA